VIAETFGVQVRRRGLRLLDADGPMGRALDMLEDVDGSPMRFQQVRYMATSCGARDSPQRWSRTGTGCDVAVAAAWTMSIISSSG
jgi:hypothetical protein